MGDLEIIKSSYVDLYFTDINIVNLSVKILGSMENLLPSKIRDVGAKMMEQKVCDYYSIEKKKDGFLCLSDYFSVDELFTRFKKIKGLENKVLQEKFILQSYFWVMKRLSIQNFWTNLSILENLILKTKKAKR